MLRIVVGVIAGSLAWLTLWVGGEQILSAIWPQWFGAHQLAFQAAITVNADGKDSRGLVIDPSARKACEAACAPDATAASTTWAMSR